MVEKIGHIKNPLTVIAIFAALAEVSGTVVLPLLEKETQHVYVWFLMAFPIFLVALFFYVLYKKNHVLYAPTDFKDDKTFEQLSSTYHSKKTSETILIDKDTEQNLKIQGLQKQVTEIAAVTKISVSEVSTGDSLNWDAWPVGLNLNRPDYKDIRNALRDAQIPISTYFGQKIDAPSKWVIALNEAMPISHKVKLLKTVLPFGFDGISLWMPVRDAGEDEDVYIGSYGVRDYAQVTDELKDLLEKDGENIEEIDLVVYCEQHTRKAKKIRRVIEEEAT